MSNPSCFGCRKTSICDEFSTVVSEDPKRILTHSCSEYSGISQAEQDARADVLEQLGIAAVLGLESVKRKTERKKSKMASHTEEGLKKLDRHGLRAVAHDAGFPKNKSLSTPSADLIKFVLDNQGKKGGKPVLAAAAKPPAGVDPDTGEITETPPATRAPAAGSSLTMEALAEAVGHQLDEMEAANIRRWAVVDRKLNIILGNLGTIGSAVNPDSETEYDPLQHELTFGKEEHTVDLGAIQEEATAGEQEER